MTYSVSLRRWLSLPGVGGGETVNQVHQPASNVGCGAQNSGKELTKMLNLSSQTWKVFGLIALLTIALAPLDALLAQQTTDDEETAVEETEEVEDAEIELMDEIIVTGTADGAQLRKFDASFAITTLPADDIEKFSPKSTADLLKVVPGVWSESSGGVSGANVFVRGFPGGGDAPYLTVQINGSSFFPPPTLSFLENTTLFRVDETVLRMEALRGGPNPVFSNGQPGLTTNFLLREGGEETEGFVKYTTSDYDLRRFDGYVSGKIADDFYYMIGGYVSSSPGLRDSGFNSDEGFQLTLNLTRNLERGKINLFHRETDDSGTWYLPVALNVPGVDNQYNQIGALNRQRRILFANNFGDPSFENPSAKTVDLGEGRGWDGGVTGGSVVFDIGNDWELVDRFSYMSGDANTLGLVPNGGAVQIGALRADPTLDPAAVITGPITGSVSGRPIADSEYIQQFGAWEVLKDLEAFTNDLSLTKHFGKGDFTLGFYSANSSTDEFWSLGNHKYEVVQVGGEVVTGIACNDPTVDSCTWNYDIDAKGDATTEALYAATTFDAAERWTFDVGVRVENHTVEYSVDEGLDGLVTLGLSFDETETSWTAAANYGITDSVGAFARINSGSKMPYFDDFRDNRGAFAGGNLLIQEVDQLELGLKWVTKNLSVYGTAFRTEVDPTFFIALTGAGPADIITQEATGIELDALWNSGTGFYVTLNATIQDTEIKRGPNAGNETQRQPGWQLRVTPSYSFQMGNSLTTVYGTFTAVDDRWGEPENVNRLAGYEKIDVGAIVGLSGGFSVHLSADNVTDEDALTESDPRDLAAPNGRFIMPRSVRLGVGYRF